MKLTQLCLIATLGLMAAPAMADTTWNLTGPRGGTGQGTASCAAAEGTRSCQSASTYTNPNGKVATKSGTYTGNGTEGARSVTTTGPNGRTNTRGSTWLRTN